MRSRHFVSLSSLAIIALALLAFPEKGKAQTAQCTSGGQGATGCSQSHATYGSCSVTCGSGYYACCRGTWTSGAVCTCVGSN